MQISEMDRTFAGPRYIFRQKIAEMQTCVGCVTENQGRIAVSDGILHGETGEQMADKAEKPEKAEKSGRKEGGSSVVPFIPSDINIYPKSNFLIGSKYKSTLLENKIMAYSLANADKFDYGKSNSERETIQSVIPVSELRAALNANRGSFYQQLDAVAKSMTGKSIGMSSPDSKHFDYIAVVTRARLENGRFIIEYNGAMRSVIGKLQSNFSKLNLSIQMKFTNNYSFRMYELLKSKCYHQRGDLDQSSNTYLIRMSLSELKLELGIVNAELDAVKRVLRDSTNPDYDRAVEIAPERMFDNWSEFRRKVLEKSLKEINEISDLRASWTTEKHGIGGKVHSIDFTVTVLNANDYNRQSDEAKSGMADAGVSGAGASASTSAAPVNSSSAKAAGAAAALSEDEQLDFLDSLREFTGSEFTSKELRNFAVVSGWNRDKVKAAYDLYRTKKSVENPVGWILSAIRNDYCGQNASGRAAASAAADNASGNIKASSHGTSGETSPWAGEYQQTEYDFDEMQRVLTKN